MPAQRGGLGAGARARRAEATPSLAQTPRASAGLIYGAAIGQQALDDPAYAALYRRETRILTTENALKFDWLRPAPDRFDFSAADAIVHEARKRAAS